MSTVEAQIAHTDVCVRCECRPIHGQMGHPASRGPPMGWRPQGGPGLGHPQVGPSPYGAPAGPRGGPVTGVPQMVS